MAEVEKPSVDPISGATEGSTHHVYCPICLGWTVTPRGVERHYVCDTRALHGDFTRAQHSDDLFCPVCFDASGNSCLNCGTMVLAP